MNVYISDKFSNAVLRIYMKAGPVSR